MFPALPNKSVVNQTIERSLQMIENKSTPSMSLTGDQPVDALKLEVRNENSSRDRKIIEI